MQKKAQFPAYTTRKTVLTSDNQLVMNGSVNNKGSEPVPYTADDLFAALHMYPEVRERLPLSAADSLAKAIDQIILEHVENYMSYGMQSEDFPGYRPSDAYDREDNRESEQ